MRSRASFDWNTERLLKEHGFGMGEISSKIFWGTAVVASSRMMVM
jgi:hypothetical protein